ncbi:MAG: hypothetical protein HY543_09995 [Deltaproteobacteria bacterium]|nr:hypothetical protein [Deltaproteobacteria bacterium]
MGREIIGHNRAVFGDLHPLVYHTVVGLALWFVLSAWVFFGGWDYMGLALTVVSGFFLMAMAIPLLLWLTWRRNREAGRAESGSGTFRHWAAGDFAICQGRLAGAEAAAQVILPIAAVSIGLTLIGIVLVAVAY